MQQLCHALFLWTTKCRIVCMKYKIFHSDCDGKGWPQSARASLLLFLAFVAGFIKVLSSVVHVCLPLCLFVCLSVCLFVCLFVSPALPVARSTSG